MESPHYHIRWAGKPLDWERFASAEEAQSYAAEVVLHGETYSLDEFNGYCIRCMRPTVDSLDEILAAAVRDGKAQFGTMQLFDDETAALRIVAHQGVSQRFVDYFQVVHSDNTSCAKTAREKKPVVVVDVANDPAFTAAPTIEVMRGEGIYSCQSVPLVTTAGQLAGVMSVHYRDLTPDMPLLHEPGSAGYVSDVADHLIRFIRGSR